MQVVGGMGGEGVITRTFILLFLLVFKSLNMQLSTYLH